MNLNLNSLSARLYRWFYATEKMPQTLCPYFWKLVIMWMFILPYSLISLPVILMDRKDPEHRTTGERIALGGAIWFMLCTVISMITVFGLFFKIPTKDTLYMQIVTWGFIGWILTVFISIVGLVKWIKEKRRQRAYRARYDENGNWIPQEYREPKPNIIVEFIKAKYNKYCPKIDWK